MAGPIDNATFDTFRELIERECGIHLSDEKRQLLSNRLQKRLRALKLTDAFKYLEIIESDLEGEELLNLLDAISTNTTYFNREEKHFELLASYLKELAKNGRREIKFWCAASSTGEEPYDLAMTALETVHPHAAQVRILATDISRRVLNHATKGVYDEKQTEKLPQHFCQKYFTHFDDDEGRRRCQIKPEVAKLVLFKRLNLAEQPYPLKGDFDFIFCRNVMIYFQRPLRQKILDSFTKLLRPGGRLFLSHSENLLGITHSLRTVATAVYERTGGA